MKEQLRLFKEQDKFSVERWKEKGLNSSEDEISQFLNQFFNKCAEGLICCNKTELKPFLLKKLSLIDGEKYDTEEREFIIDYFVELSDIVEVDIKKGLMKWMYGRDVVMFSEEKENEVLDILHETCVDCKVELKTKIILRQKGIPNFAYFIVKCKKCNGLNMLDLGEDIKQFSMENYSIEKQLVTSNYTKSQALKELKDLRKNS